MAPVADGVEICYQTFGDPADEPVLLVMGLGGPDDLVEPRLLPVCSPTPASSPSATTTGTSAGPRGCGGRVTRKRLVQAFVGRGPRPPYTLDDMAGDGFGLLDHLGIDSAHVVGVSMGGMIVQTMALLRPDRVRSMTSIMSTTGTAHRRLAGPPAAAAADRTQRRTREAYVASSARVWRIIGSPAFRETREAVDQRAGETFDRG